MNEATKLLASLLLLTAGFFSASLFGPPKLVDRLAENFVGPNEPDAYSLRPLPASEADRAVTPRWASPAAPSRPVQPAAWPSESPAAPQQEPLAQSRPQSQPQDDWFRSATDWMERQKAPAYEATAQRGELKPVPRVAAKPVSEPSRSLDENPWGVTPGPVLEEASAPDAGWRDFTPRRAEQAVQPVAKPARETRYREHVVTDGDTLPLLARRYLGDESRAQELFELNQDRLDHPDLLPIGVVIRTPIEQHVQRAPAKSEWPSPQRAPGFFSGVSTQETAVTPESRSAALGPLRPIGAPVENHAITPAADLFDNGRPPVYESDLAW